MATSHSNYKQNTPTFNVDRKISTFKDFTSNVQKEIEDLEDVKRSFRHEEDNIGNIANVHKTKYNKVTHKLDQLSKPEVQDKLDVMEEITENIGYKKLRFLK